MKKCISPQEEKQWRENGYVFVKNMFTKKDISNVIDFLQKQPVHHHNDFGSDGKWEFPTCTCFDTITMSENIINCVQKLLQTKDILLTQSDVWSKIGTPARKKNYNADQRMHMDYGNHTFLHPSNWYSPEAVSAIVYFSDIKTTGGGTAVVPRTPDTMHLYKMPYVNMPGQNNIDFINDKNLAEEYIQEHFPDISSFRRELYQNEIVTSPTIGDVLFYRLDLWHRGTPVHVGKIRNVMNLTWKKKHCTWIHTWNPGFTKKMYHKKLEAYFCTLSPLQRSVLGIPLPHDSYWNAQTIQLLQQRYKNIDHMPYISKL